jgi:transcriptional regulator with XRE-family HTH domain
MGAADKVRARKIETRTSTMRKPYHFVGSGLPNVYLVGVEYEVDRETEEQRAAIPRLPDLLTWIAVTLLSKEAPLTGEELRFLRKRVGKSSKDFAELLGLTSEQFSRIENGLRLTPSNDKLVRLLVMGLSVVEALKQPELMERVAKQTWTSHVGPNQRIIARVDAAQGWTVETKAA